MDGDDHRAASSLLATDRPQTTERRGGGGGGRQRRNEFLYDANGKRLKGVAAAAAELLHDQKRYAIKPEDQQFFHAHVWRGPVPAAAAVTAPPQPPLGRGSSPLPACSTGGVARKADMFGSHTGALALERAVMAWGGEEGAAEEEGERERGPDVGAVGSGDGRVYGALFPLHRWGYVRRKASPFMAERRSRQESAETSAAAGRGPDDDNDGARPRFLPQGRWKRADELLETEALLLSADNAIASCNTEDGEYLALLSEVLSAYNLMALCASGDRGTGGGNAATMPTAGSAVLGLGGLPPRRGKLHGAFSFFTFTAEEYASLPARSEGEFAFDCSSARKLFALYERYGSLVLVADRWSSDEGGQTDPAATPSVEDLCLEKERVTRGVMLQRARRLQQALLPLCERGSQSDTAAVTRQAPPRRRPRKETEEQGGERTASEDAFSKVNHHPLMTLLLKHPALANCEGLLQSPPSEAQAPHAASLPLAAPVVLVERPSIAELFKDLTTPSAERAGAEGAVRARCYRMREEKQRRGGLRQLLEGERVVNMPYQRAAAKYLSLAPKVSHALRRLHRFLRARPRDGGNPGGASVLEGTASFGRLPPLWKEDPSLFTLPLHELPAVDPTLWQAANKAFLQQPPRLHEELLDEGQRKGVVRRSAMTAAAAAVQDASSLESTVYEVFHELPVTCRRLLLAAQAGWMLPPPEPLAATSGAGPCRNDRGARNERPSSDGNPATAATATRRVKKPKRRQRSGSDSGENDSSGDSEEDDPSRAAAGCGGLTRAQKLFLSDIVASGMCNRCHSMLSEGVLITVPQAAPRVHKEVEEDLEKYIWDDAVALMDNSPPVVAHYVPAIRLAYTQNILLKRFLGRLESLLEVMQKLEAAAMEVPD